MTFPLHFIPFFAILLIFLPSPDGYAMSAGEKWQPRRHSLQEAPDGLRKHHHIESRKRMKAEKRRGGCVIGGRHYPEGALYPSHPYTFTMVRMKCRHGRWVRTNW